MPNPAISIREATLSDLPDVARIHVTSWQQTYIGQVPQDYLDALNIAARQKGWEDIFEGKTAEDKNLNIAYLDGEPVGFISFGRGRDDGMRNHGEIYAVYLLEESWGKTAGYSLFQSATQQLLKDGFTQAYLWVLDTNAQAIRAYQRWGGEVDKTMTKDDVINDHPIREIIIKFPRLS